MRGYWAGNTRGPSAQATLPFSTQDATVLKTLLDQSTGEEHERYLTELNTRFIGNPYATQIRYENLSADQAKESVLRGQIAIDKDNWEWIANWDSSCSTQCL